MHENRETSAVSRLGGTGPGRPEGRTPDVYAGEESDRAIVPMKPPNKGAPASAEGAEGRALVKENTCGPHT